MKSANKKTKATNKKRPMYIVMLGGEGSGKSTMLALVKERFADKVKTTREPGGSDYAEQVRKVIEAGKGAPDEALFYLFWAARFDHLHRLVMPSLKNGTTVVSDRGDCCTYAYNVWAGNRSFEKLFWQIRERLPRKPDLYIFFDVEIEEGLRRAGKRGTGNFFDEKDLTFHNKVRAGYRRFLKRVPHVIINANQPIKNVELDFLALMQKIVG